MAFAQSFQVTCMEWMELGAHGVSDGSGPSIFFLFGTMDRFRGVSFGCPDHSLTNGKCIAMGQVSRDLC